MSATEQAQSKMKQAGASQTAIDVFTHHMETLAQGSSTYIREDDISPLGGVTCFEDVASSDVDPSAIRATAMIKLNGGLATTMGLDSPKSLLPVKDGKTFLDITIDQIRHARSTYGARLPLIFMDSFRTQKATLDALPEDMTNEGLPVDFLQGMVPKLDAQTHEPVSWPRDPELEWCPPGHGDIFTALYQQGLVKTLIEQGYEYLAVSNSDNLGASPSAEIAAWFAESGADFAPEVCVRTAADRKGGHLATRNADGKIILREVAQTHPDDLEHFGDVDRHRYFNTNSLWFNLRSLDRLLDEHNGVLDLPLITNRKTVDPSDPTSTPCLQLETAMGTIIEMVDVAAPIVVPRTRFMPVKSTSDLLALRSDAYELNEDGTPTLTIDQAPLVTLASEYYGRLADFDARFEEIPSLREATSLTITGDVYVKYPFIVRGDVTLDESVVIAEELPVETTE